MENLSSKREQSESLFQGEKIPKLKLRKEKSVRLHHLLTEDKDSLTVLVSRKSRVCTNVW